MAEDFKIFHESLERDLKRLIAEIQRMETGAESGPILPEREIVRRSLEKVTAEIAPPSTPQVAPLSQSQSGDGSLLPSYLVSNKTDPRVRFEIERLVDSVFHEGLEKAVKEAKKHPPFVLDAFHDALTDKLIPILIERGVLK
jgi:hypothetical protein